MIIKEINFNNNQNINNFSTFAQIQQSCAYDKYSVNSVLHVLSLLFYTFVLKYEKKKTVIVEQLKQFSLESKIWKKLLEY